MKTVLSVKITATPLTTKQDRINNYVIIVAAAKRCIEFRYNVVEAIPLDSVSRTVIFLKDGDEKTQETPLNTRFSYRNQWRI